MSHRTIIGSLASEKLIRRKKVKVVEKVFVAFTYIKVLIAQYRNAQLHVKHSYLE